MAPGVSRYLDIAADLRARSLRHLGDVTAVVPGRAPGSTAIAVLRTNDGAAEPSWWWVDDAGHVVGSGADDLTPATPQTEACGTLLRRLASSTVNPFGTRTVRPLP